MYPLERHQIDGHGSSGSYTSSEYPLFRRMRAAVADRAELLAISPAAQIDVTFGAERESEGRFRQYVSGRMFASFGLRPALGRLLTEADDRTPGAHPYAVLSHDYWSRRFGRDPRVIGRTFRIGATHYEIVGVANEGFTGTDTGTVTDLSCRDDASGRGAERLELVPDVGSGQSRAWRSSRCATSCRRSS